jgi:hypothetical protein
MRVFLENSLLASSALAAEITATGLPLDITVTTSPDATSRSTLEKYRFASAAEMVFTQYYVVFSTTIKTIL